MQIQYYPLFKVINVKMKALWRAVEAATAAPQSLGQNHNKQLDEEPLGARTGDTSF